ncbi:hypothetical protein VN12_08195 [Pirellula sp. SH-Sr6A]|nr:hypothetical protein VN12_08195 [Pirellula sp. SH-Sr6A]
MVKIKKLDESRIFIQSWRFAGISMTSPKDQKSPLGIVCPQCGCHHFYTTHTEPLRDGRIRRRKQCRHCFRRIVTYESAPTQPRKC